MKSKEIITKMMPACPNPVLPCKPHPVSSQKIQTNFELLSEKFEKICQLFLKNLKGNTNFDEIVGPNTSGKFMTIFQLIRLLTKIDYAVPA